jgi:hypothetical protein
MAVRVPKAEWLAQRLAAEQARGLYGTKHYDWATGQWLNADNTPTKGPKPPNPFGREGSLSQQISRDVNKTINDKRNEEKKKLASGQKRLTRDEIKTAVKSGKTIWADAASDCFYSLSWRPDPDGDGTEGTAHAVFNKRDSGEGYDYDVDIDTFLDWASDSLGQFFNAEIR